MSFITDWYRQITDRIADAVADRVLTESGQRVAQMRAFRLGRQPRQLKVKTGQYDDNMVLNFSGLIIDRMVSMLIGGGIAFKFDTPEVTDPETGEVIAADEGVDPPQKEYIEAVWDANHQEILLHRSALAAAESGTGYIMLHDPALEMGGMAGEDGNIYPRLLMLDPAFVTMETLPEDHEMVIRYIIQYKIVNLNGREKARRRIIEQDDGGVWVILDEESDHSTGGQWVEVARLDWPYPFCPVIHWQNLPTIDSPYGEPDITDDIVELQNKLNFSVSNLSKILRLNAHPQRWGRDVADMTKVDVGPDKMIVLGPNGEMGQLDPNADWPGMLAFVKFLRAALFDATRTVDIDSLQDKLGTMTNFALRVLYQDNSSKIKTKRELMGDALEEINRRLQIMAGMEPLDCEVIWQDFLPVNEQERSMYLQTLLALGVMSKQTVAEQLDLDWEQEQGRMDGEKQATDNLGAFLLGQFNRGEGAGMPNPPPVRPGNNGQPPVV